MNDSLVRLSWRFASNEAIVHRTGEGRIRHEGLDGRKWVKIWPTNRETHLPRPLLNLGRLMRWRGRSYKSLVKS